MIPVILCCFYFYSLVITVTDSSCLFWHEFCRWNTYNAALSDLEDNMTDITHSHSLPVWWKIPAGFIAGFLATLIFHQLILTILWVIKIAPFSPFPMHPTKPLGIPAVFSLAFWGGIWGIIYIYVHLKFPKGAGYWLLAFLFGAIFPTLVAMLVVLPLKGKPMGGGWHLPLLVTAVLINGSWGIGTGFFLKFLFRRRPPR
jgi:hypothetical protein